MTRSRIGVAGITLLALACHGRDARAQSCQKDNDCPGDLICNAGQCQTMSGAAPAPADVPSVARTAAPAAAAAGTVTVQFNGESLVVTDKFSAQACRTPCSMLLRPGSHSIDVNGQFHKEIFVGSRGGTYDVTLGDTGLIVGGALGTAFGISGIIVGGVFTIIGNAEEDEEPSSYSTSETDSSSMADVGKPLLFAGIPLAVVGIVMLSSAEFAGIKESAPFAPGSGGPMVGVAPVEGGAMMGAMMRF